MMTEDEAPATRDETARAVVLAGKVRMTVRTTDGATPWEAFEDAFLHVLKRAVSADLIGPEVHALFERALAPE